MNSALTNAASALLTAEQLAQKLQVRKTTVAHWARIGTIPSVRIGRRIVRFDPTVVYKALGLEVSA
jgi:excisionase family DNA binding protein